LTNFFDEIVELHINICKHVASLKCWSFIFVYTANDEKYLTTKLS